MWQDETSLSALPQNVEIEGKVIGFSDSGSEPRAFALVEVVRTQTVVVRVGELGLVEPAT